VLQEVDDSTLIRRVLDGERDDFRFLVRRYQDLIYGMTMRQVGEPALAQDLTQEIFIKAFNGLSRFEHRASFKTWITRIALNTVSSYFQSRSHRQRQRTLELLQSHHPHADEADDSADKERALTSLQKAVAELDPKCREVIVLCKLEGKTYEEAAEILQIAAGTVGSRLSAAQHELRRRFWRIHR
jgi:RNA polymerase sigma-70 factor (ECF subfamily)